METIKKLVFLLLILAASIPGSFAQTECAGITNELSQGSGLGNYRYGFTTTGNTVTVEFEVLNPPSGLANQAYAFTENPNFAETPMPKVAGTVATFRQTFANQSNGQPLTAGFAFKIRMKIDWAAGGIGVTKQFTYTVGNTCGGGNPLPAPTLGAFSVPAKVFGDPAFTLTAPSSNSTGEFSYTSSNLGVATISGNTVTIVGGGTSTITANQAASTTHAAGTTTATLVVTNSITTPTAGPVTPPARNAWDVLSQYGSAYNSQPGVVFDNFGGANIVGDVTLADESVVKKYTNYSYSGISTNGAMSLNVSQMTHMHIDVWSPDFASFKIKLEAANGSNRELEVPFGKAQGVWNSYDIPLSNYSSGAGAVDLNNLKWIVPVTFDPNNTTLFITNVYFYRPATVQPPTLGTFTVPAKNVGDPAFTLTPPSSNSAGAFAYTSSNPAVATIAGDVLTIVGGGTSTITATQAANGGFGQGVATATFTASYPAPGPSPVPPARNPADVVSMFTGTPTVYANGVTAVRADWSNGATTVTEVPNGSNTALRVNNMGFLGYVTNAANFSAAGMTKLHVDVYLNAPLPSLFVFLISNGDKIHTATGLTAGWNSLDIDLATYVNAGADLSSIYGLKFESNSSPGAFQMYLDNVYFYVPTGIDPTITDFNIPEKVFGDEPFELTPPNSNSAGVFTYTSSNTNVATISGSTVTIVGAGTSTITASQAADGTYEAGSITASLVVANAPLATAAPTPPARNEWDVISIYSNAYTEQSSPAWQNQAMTTDEQLEGNDTKKMSDFQIETVTFAPTNLTEMTTLHMDIYSEDCTAMNIWLLNNGDRNAQISLVPNQWNSVNIPLSTYVALGLNLNGVIFIKFESLNGPGKTVYVDNVYFFRPATSLPPTITDFSIPAKNFGDPDFELTAPISNSSGAFTYTSSNPAVATISGSTVHIVGPGTSTITANQAADGSYGAGSITAQLSVAFPAPGPSPVPPARDADRVVSMYTGTPSVYADAITAVRSYWTGGTTMTEIPNGTNTALRLDNFGFLGLIDQNETHFSVAGMSHLNVDIYLNAPLNANPALSRVFIFLLSNGDHLYDAANLVAGWNTVKIPLTSFPGANPADIYGLKFEQNTSALTQIYIDNVYFSNECYTYYADADGDGYGNAEVSILACEATPGYVLDNTDCDDEALAVHPAAAEVPYNGVDDNCDGTIDEGSRVYSQVLASQCGVTLTSISSLIGAVSHGAIINGYRFRVVNNATNAVQEIDRPLAHFSLTMLTTYDYATTYTISVMLRRNGVWLNYYGPECLISTPAILSPGGAAAVSPSQCGSVLPSISTLIATTSLPGVRQYRFRVTNLADDGDFAEQTIERSYNWFSLTMLDRFNYGTEYQVEVAVKTANGNWTGYGAPCNVTSPEVPTLTNCGATIASSGTLIATASLNRVQAYRFEVTNLASLEQNVIDRPQNWFRFNQVPDFTPGAVYGVRVSVQTSGYWSPFAEVCEITAPGAVARGIDVVDNETASVDFRAVVYPNPYSESFALDMDTSSQDNIRVKVYDMVGKLVEDREFATDAIEMQQFGERYPSGVYNIVVTQAGSVKTLRVIKR